MIVRYIYTDCASDGPYAKGNGYKFKSVVFPRGFASNESLESVRELLPKNSLAQGYEVPEVPDSMTSTDFANLPKSWAYAKTSANGYTFQRMSTNGKSYGRPNKFFEGFTFSEDAWPLLTATNKEATRPVALRPADFTHSNGWLNPRGEAELEAANLDDSFYTLKDDFREQLKSDLAAVKRLPALGQITASFANAQLAGAAAHLPTSQREHFFAIVSVFTRLIPAVYAWQTGFSDAWTTARDTQLADGKNPHLLITNEPNVTPAALAVLWGKLATEALASGMPGKLIKRIDDLSNESLIFNPKTPEEGLAALPLAVLNSEPAELEGKETLRELAIDLLKYVNGPATNSEKIERLLANGRPLA